MTQPKKLTKKPTKFLRKQPPMRRVILATLPCIAGSIYFFGWRSLAVVAVSCLFGLLTEYLFCRNRGEPVSEAVFVSAVLYGLIMPPSVPWHVLIIGIVFAVTFAKEAFGGFGRNIFNPALSGRCFVYVCFPVAMTSQWAPAARGPLGALAKWTTAAAPDAVTSATPMALMKAGQAAPELADLLLGRIDGTMGVTSALLILLGGLYLFYTKTANRTVIITVIAAYAVLTELLYRAGAPQVRGALPALLGGGFLFGAFFMATDPVTQPTTQPARIIFGVLIALFAVIIRNFSVFNGGMMFAILLANMFGPIIDYAVKEHKKKKKAAAASGRASP